ncbi:MAG: hypothetical protein AMS19_06010 [Gemmatimonas sp. SG8_23]|jgi:hypothetical protein|nr:MAG: hypothetical protein AMS19_06010 [Gemmatimonas sp. SG8_23]
MDVVWNSMGFMRWPLAFSLLCVVLLSAYSFGRLYRPSATADLLTKTWLDAILFWGGFAMIAGVLGTLVGVVIAAQAIEAAGAVSPSLVWGGIKVAMLTSAFGTLILAASALLWFGLQLRWRLLEAREVGEA